MAQGRPLHYEESNVARLNSELLTACAVGSLKGLVIGVGLYFAIGLPYPAFRRVRTPFKAAWFVYWIGMGTVFAGDKHVLVYSAKYKQEKEQLDREFMERAADNGEYIDRI